MRYDNKNPAELYPSTTWELLSSDKYIRTGNTPLQIGGSNSVSILKENLPNTKLQVEPFNLTTKKHTHDTNGPFLWTGDKDLLSESYASKGTGKVVHPSGNLNAPRISSITAEAGGENTGTASPTTETLGSGTALTIQPSYITLKFWKRLS